MIEHEILKTLAGMFQAPIAPDVLARQLPDVCRTAFDGACEALIEQGLLTVVTIRAQYGAAAPGRYYQLSRLGFLSGQNMLQRKDAP